MEQTLMAAESPFCWSWHVFSRNFTAPPVPDHSEFEFIHESWHDEAPATANNAKLENIKNVRFNMASIGQI